MNLPQGLTDDIKQRIEAQKKLAEEKIGKCVKEVSLDPEVAKKLTYGDFSQRDEKAKCFVKCFFEQSGFIDKDGKPVKNVILEKLKAKAEVKPEGLEAIVDKCIKEKGTDTCDTTYKIYECYWTNKVAQSPRAATAH